MNRGLRIAAIIGVTTAGIGMAPPAALGSLASAAVSAPAVTRHLANTTTAPMAQTDQAVYALTVGHGVLYAGGAFTHLHFRGDTYAREHLAAVRTSTGTPTSFRPNVDGNVLAVALSPDRKVLYIGGRFTHVNGKYRKNVAGIYTNTGKLTGWAPKVMGGAVHALVVRSKDVYIGGSITSVNGVARQEVAEVTRSGAKSKVTAFHPSVDAWVRAMAITPSGRWLLLGGGFTHINGHAYNALGAVNLQTGATDTSFASTLIPRYSNPATHYSEVTSFTTDGTTMYAGAEGTGGGVFDGTLAFHPDTGKLVWRNTCLGATQAVKYLRGVLYKASHAHDCSTSANGFPQLQPHWQAHHLLAQNPATGALLNWGQSTHSVAAPTPNTNGGLNNQLGPYAFAIDGPQLFVGGEFTKVVTMKNGHITYTSQTGLARFAG